LKPTHYNTYLVPTWYTPLVTSTSILSSRYCIDINHCANHQSTQSSQHCHYTCLHTILLYEPQSAINHTTHFNRSIVIYNIRYILVHFHLHLDSQFIHSSFHSSTIHPIIIHHDRQMPHMPRRASIINWHHHTMRTLPSRRMLPKASHGHQEEQQRWWEWLW